MPLLSRPGSAAWSNRALAHVLALVCVAALWLPLVVLLIDAATTSRSTSPAGTVVLSGFNVSAQPDPLAGTIALTLAVVSVALLLGVPVGVALSRTRVVGRHAAHLLMLAPLVVPTYVAARSWQRLAFPAADGLSAAAWSLGTSLWPIVALFTAAAVARTDPRGEDAAVLAGGRAMAWRVVIAPRAWATVGAGAALVALFALRDFGVPALFRVNTVALDVASAFESRADSGRFAIAMRHATPLLITGLIAALALLTLERFGGLSSQPRLSNREPAALPPRRSLSGSVVVWLVLAASPGVPLIRLLHDAIAPGNFISRFADKLTETYTAASILRTLETAALAALLATVLFGLVSWWLARQRRAWSRIAHAAAVLPLAAPGALIGIGVLRLTVPRSAPGTLADLIVVLVALAAAWLWLVCARIRRARRAGGVSPRRDPDGNGQPDPSGGLHPRLAWLIALVIATLIFWLTPRPAVAAGMQQLIEGPFIVALVHALLFAPFVVRLIGPTTAAVPPLWRDATRLSGLGPARSAALLDWPLLRPSLIVSAALVFVFSAGEVAATVLIAPPGDVLMAPRIYNLVHYGRESDVALLCLVFTLITLLPLAVALGLAGRRLRSL